MLITLVHLAISYHHLSGIEVGKGEFTCLLMDLIASIYGPGIVCLGSEISAQHENLLILLIEEEW